MRNAARDVLRAGLVLAALAAGGCGPEPFPKPPPVSSGQAPARPDDGARPKPPAPDPG